VRLHDFTIKHQCGGTVMIKRGNSQDGCHCRDDDGESIGDKPGVGSFMETLSPQLPA
jgi:hypothetical protein